MNNLIRFPLMVAMALVLGTQLGNGCSSDGSYDDDYNRPPSGGWDDGEIPRRARVVVEGRGDVLRYRAAENGRVWLADADRGALLDRRAIERGEEYIISTEDGKVWIDQRRVAEPAFRRGNVHRIHYLASSEEGGSGGGSWRPPAELSGADRVAHGRGDLSYTARHDGRVWVVDRTRGEIVYRSEIRRDDRLRVSPRENYISLREGSRSSHRLNPDHDYEIYYRRGGESGQPTGPIFEDGAGATVPKTASIMREGRGEDLSFEADGPGVVYVYDVDAKRTLATHRLTRGQRFTVSPRSGEAAVDGRVVFRKSMSTRTSYKLYFDRSI